MSKKTNDALRLQWTDSLYDVLKGEDALRVGAGEIAIPVVDADGEDNWVVLTVKIPTGSRDGDAYDGYALADDYQIKLKVNAEKAAEAAAKKAAKIARDEKLRAQKAAQKAAREAKIED